MVMITIHQLSIRDLEMSLFTGKIGIGKHKHINTMKFVLLFVNTFGEILSQSLQTWSLAHGQNSCILVTPQVAQA